MNVTPKTAGAVCDKEGEAAAQHAGLPLPHLPSALPPTTASPPQGTAHE